MRAPRHLALAVALAIAGCGGSADAGVGQMVLGSAETAPVSGTATVTWLAPILDVAPIGGTGGAAISDGAGFKVYKSAISGIGPWTLVNTIVGVGTLTQAVTSLSYATWYFCVSTYDAGGNEGPCIYAGQKTIP